MKKLNSLILQIAIIVATLSNIVIILNYWISYEK